MFAMIITIFGVIIFRLVTTYLLWPLQQLMALAAGALTALSITLVLRFTRSLSTKVILTAIVCVLSVIFANAFPAFLLGVVFGLLLPFTWVGLVNLLARSADISIRPRRD